jgi:DNA-binding transcriptional LysR family regulator
VVEQALEAAGLRLKEMQVKMTLDTTEGLLSAVEAGLGVTFVSRWGIRNQLALGTLQVVEVEGLRVARMFSVAHLAGPEPVGNAGAFERYVVGQGNAVSS